MGELNEEYLAMLYDDKLFYSHTSKDFIDNIVNNKLSWFNFITLFGNKVKFDTNLFLKNLINHKKFDLTTLILDKYTVKNSEIYFKMKLLYPFASLNGNTKEFSLLYKNYSEKKLLELKKLFDSEISSYFNGIFNTKHLIKFSTDMKYFEMFKYNLDYDLIIFNKNKFKLSVEDLTTLVKWRKLYYYDKSLINFMNIKREYFDPITHEPFKIQSWNINKTIFDLDNIIALKDCFELPEYLHFQLDSSKKLKEVVKYQFYLNEYTSDLTESLAKLFEIPLLKISLSLEK